MGPRGSSYLFILALPFAALAPAGASRLANQRPHNPGHDVAARHRLGPGLRSRSGLAARHGLSIVNAPGTVDSGYRGEILVNLINLDPRESVSIEPGDRIAQLVIQEYVRGEFVEADSLPESVRGETGHGSTGGHAGGRAPTFVNEEVV